MLYELKAKVDANLLSNEPSSLEVNNYYIKLEISPDNHVNYILISKRIDNYKEYLPSFRLNNDIRHLYIPENPYHQELIDILKLIESIGSFWLDIRKIYWENPKTNWISENEEEKKLISVFNFSFNQEYDNTPTLFKPSILMQIVEGKNKLGKLIIPMAFYREGRNEYLSLRYINAYYNFYFFIEDLFGNGKTKNYQVEEEFQKSTILLKATEETIINFGTSYPKHHLNNLNKFLKMENLDCSTKGVIKLIVRVRGNLHHFSQKSTKKKGSPFDHKEFETMAFLLMSICILCFVELSTRENN